MNSNDKPYMMNDPWQRVWRTRCCPPDTVLQHEKASDYVLRHIEVCPWCRQALGEEGGLLQFDPAALHRTASGQPQPGELWAVKNSLAGWGEKSRYYSPPVVLIVKRTPSGRVDVMQVYDDETLSGPGDIHLLPECEGFAESWNRYSLAPADLDFAVGAVSSPALDQCLNAFPIFKEEKVEPGSLLWFFRNLEVETGFYFARQSIARVLDAEQTDRIGTVTGDLSSTSTEQLLSQLVHLGLQIQKTLPEDAAPLDVLAYCCLPDDRLPLAAADTNKSSFALVFVFEAGRLESYTTSIFTLQQTAIQGNSLLVSGTLPAEVVDFDEFHCWWEIDGKIISPDKGSIGCADGVFWATFSQPEPLKSQEKYDIVIRCIKYI